MRRVSLGCVLAVVALALLVAGPASAQDKQIVVAGGWAPQYFSGGGDSFTAPLGLMFNVAASIAPKVQIVGDFGFAYKSESGVSASDLTGTGGVRYVIPTQSNGGVSPFVDGLVGVSNFNLSLFGESGSVNAFTWGIGGGVDVKASKKATIRLQINYFQARANGGSLNELRFGIGISTATKM
jgi:opacity protein-like surface antigen